MFRAALPAMLVILGVVAFACFLAFMGIGDRDPYEHRREQREYCIERDGTVQEDSMGYYTGCLLDQ